MTIIGTTVRRYGLGVGTALIAIGITAALYASAQNTAGGPPAFIGRGGPMAAHGGPLGEFRMILRQLGLTDSQKEQIKGIMQAHSADWKSLAERALATHKALHEALTADAVDDSVIRQRSADVAAVQADMAVAGAHARTEVLQLLTPEQQAQVQSLQSKMQQRLDERRQRLEERFEEK